MKKYLPSRGRRMKLIILISYKSHLLILDPHWNNFTMKELNMSHKILQLGSSKAWK